MCACVSASVCICMCVINAEASQSSEKKDVYLNIFSDHLASVCYYLVGRRELQGQKDMQKETNCIYTERLGNPMYANEGENPTAHCF